MTTAPPPTVAALLLDLAARGVELSPEGDRLRYRPRSAVSPALVERIRAHKQELLYLLRSGHGYSLADLAVLAGQRLTPADVPAVAVAKSVFAALGGAAVVGFEPKPAPGTPEDLSPDERERFEERAGIMEFDGEMPRWRAERLALREIAGGHGIAPEAASSTGEEALREEDAA